MTRLWDEDALSLGRPSCMDTPTLIEWIEQQLESKEETEVRHQVIAEARKSAILSCCIQTGSMSINEARAIRARFEESYNERGVIVLSEGMTLTPIDPHKEL